MMMLIDGRAVRTSPSWAGGVCDWGKTGLLGWVFVCLFVFPLYHIHPFCNITAHLSTQGLQPSSIHSTQIC